MRNDNDTMDLFELTRLIRSLENRGASMINLSEGWMTKGARFGPRVLDIPDNLKKEIYNLGNLEWNLAGKLRGLIKDTKISIDI